MAIKRGLTKEQIMEKARKNPDVLNRGDFTKNYAEIMMNMTPEEKREAGKRDVGRDISQRAMNENVVVEIDLDRIQPNDNNAFLPYPDEKMAELKHSIELNGLWEPIIVRPKECCIASPIDKDFEIIAGHNRYEAHKQLGKDTIRCAVVNVDDITASLMVAQTNIQRDNISEMEIARSYRHTYDLMKMSNGGDRKSEAFKERRSEFRDGTLIPGEDITLQELADKYGIGRTTMFRKLRLTELIPQVVEKYERKKLTQDQAVQISFADKDMQLEFLKYYSSTDKNWIDDSKAKAFGTKARAMRGKITPVDIQEIMESGSEPKERAIKEQKISVPISLFPSKMKKKDRTHYVIRALEYVRDHAIDLTETVSAVIRDQDIDI